MLLLKQDTIKKRRVNKLLKLEPELDEREDKKYKIGVFKDSAIYTEAAKNPLLGLYYLVS